IAKSPSSVAFTVAFPLAFIFAFIFIDNKPALQVNVAVSNLDTSHALIGKLNGEENFRLTFFNDNKQLEEEIRKGKTDVIIEKNETAGFPSDIYIRSLPDKQDMAVYTERTILHLYLR